MNKPSNVIFELVIQRISSHNLLAVAGVSHTPAPHPPPLTPSSDREWIMGITRAEQHVGVQLDWLST